LNRFRSKRQELVSWGVQLHTTLAIVISVRVHLRVSRSVERIIHTLLDNRNVLLRHNHFDSLEFEKLIRLSGKEGVM
jgi:hypothetical protein